MYFEKLNEKERKCPRGLRILGLAVGGIILAAVVALIFGFVVQLLWNWLMPAVFGLGRISFLQAAGLIALCKILFGSFHHDRRFHAEQSRSSRFSPVRKSHFHDRKDAAGRRDAWKYYDQFWQEEGKAHFDNFMKKTDLNNQKES